MPSKQEVDAADRLKIEGNALFGKGKFAAAIEVSSTTWSGYRTNV
jgi:hypothetical protein